MGLFDRLKRSRYVSPEERKADNIKYLRKRGIAVNTQLPCIPDSRELSLRPWDQVVDRAIAALIAAQLAVDIEMGGDIDEAQIFCLQLLEQYDVKNALLEKEKRLFAGTYSRQDAIDIVWNYESYWALIWALGLIGGKQMEWSLCHQQRAIDLVAGCRHKVEFASRCKPRDIEEILNMLDLHYRYHWACVERSVDPDTATADLEPDAVWERRKALEWLVCETEDWDEIELDT